MKVPFMCVALFAVFSSAMANESCQAEDICSESEKEAFKDDVACHLVQYSDGSTAYLNFESACSIKEDSCKHGNEPKYYPSLVEMCDDSSWNIKTPTNDEALEEVVEQLQ